jgi:hypothetical protein
MDVLEGAGRRCWERRGNGKGVIKLMNTFLIPELEQGYLCHLIFPSLFPEIRKPRWTWRGIPRGLATT